MDIQEIYKLMECFETSHIAELSLEHSGSKIKLKKFTTCHPLVSDVTNEEAPYPISPVTDVKTETSIAVKAPIVGTFYRSPSPEDEPFVKVGQAVKKGDVLGIIEAMKLMNEIVAPENGIIENIQVDNGSMVEFDQILLTISKGE